MVSRQALPDNLDHCERESTHREERLECDPIRGSTSGKHGDCCDPLDLLSTRLKRVSQ